MDSAAETADTRMRVSPVTSSGRRAVLLTADNIAIEAEHRPRAQGSGRLAIVVAHGFTGSLDRPAVCRAARQLSRHAGVVTFSFRGHGRSGGRSTVGDLEVLDLDAAVAWARCLGYEQVATVGFSMGGSVVLRHAARAGEDAVRAGEGAVPVPVAIPAPAPALGAGAWAVAEPADRAGAGTSAVPGAGSGAVAGAAARRAGGGARPWWRAGAESWQRVDAVVAVSSPARWYYRGTAPMRRVHWVVTRPAGRLVSRVGLRTRIHPEDWDPVPLSPVEAAAYIPPTPLLVVHGDRDTYFPLDHPLSLVDAAGEGGAELWVERGFGHAENAAGPELLGRIGDWLTARVRQNGRSHDARTVPYGG